MGSSSLGISLSQQNLLPAVILKAYFRNPRHTEYFHSHRLLPSVGSAVYSCEEFHPFQLANKILCLGVRLYLTPLGARCVLRLTERGCKLRRAFCQLSDTEIIFAVRGDRGHDDDVFEALQSD